MAYGLTKLQIAIQVGAITEPFGITPGWVTQTKTDTWDTVIKIGKILHNPQRVLAGLGQQVSDTVEEKGITYALSYTVTDIAIAILVDKGIVKLRGADKADDIAAAGNYADDVAHVTDEISDTTKVVNQLDDVADEVVDGVKAVEGGLDTIIKNGKVSIDDIRTNPSAFSGKSAEEISDVLRNSGYDVTIKNSTRSRSGAQIIRINKPGGGKNISQVQVSPGGGRNGSNPYVKISTTDQGIIKIVDGIESTYKTDGKETATIIFGGGN